MTPVDRVTIHHRGGGSPSDVSSDYSEGGYTYGIGLTRWEWFRPVWASYATLGFNHVSLDVCFSGNRMTAPVTDSDLTLLRGAVADARGRGYVVDHPTVVAHKNSPGSSTECPGDFTMNRWPAVVAACQKLATPTPKEDDMGMVVIHGDGIPAGRKKKYKLYPDERAVLCANGGRLVGDTGPTALGCWWHFRSNGRPDGLCLDDDGQGVVVTAEDNGTFAAKFA